MKKILIFVVIFSFLIGMSGVALAQSELNECCKVTQNITGVGGENIMGGAVPVFVGGTDNSSCDLNGNGAIEADTDILNKAGTGKSVA